MKKNYFIQKFKSLYKKNGEFFTFLKIQVLCVQKKIYTYNMVLLTIVLINTLFLNMESTYCCSSVTSGAVTLEESFDNKNSKVMSSIDMVVLAIFTAFGAIFAPGATSAVVVGSSGYAGFLLMKHLLINEATASVVLEDTLIIKRSEEEDLLEERVQGSKTLEYKLLSATALKTLITYLIKNTALSQVPFVVGHSIEIGLATSLYYFAVNSGLVDYLIKVFSDIISYIFNFVKDLFTNLKIPERTIPVEEINSTTVLNIKSNIRYLYYMFKYNHKRTNFSDVVVFCDKAFARAFYVINNSMKFFIYYLNYPEFLGAATKIQSNWHGYVVRRDIAIKNFVNSLIHLDFRTFSEAAVKIQSQARGWLVRQHMQRENAAATRIQASARGWLVRHHIALERQEQENTSAIRIQSQARGWLVRHHIALERVQQENAAATRIQASARGWLVRQHMRQENAAAERIQEFARGWLVRHHIALERLRQENAAAERIQEFARGWLVRHHIALERLRQENAAAAAAQQNPDQPLDNAGGQVVHNLRQHLGAEAAVLNRVARPHDIEEEAAVERPAAEPEPQVVMVQPPVPQERIEPVLAEPEPQVVVVQPEPAAVEQVVAQLAAPAGPELQLVVQPPVPQERIGPAPAGPMPQAGVQETAAVLRQNSRYTYAADQANIFHLASEQDRARYVAYCARNALSNQDLVVFFAIQFAVRIELLPHGLFNRNHTIDDYLNGVHDFSSAVMDSIEVNLREHHIDVGITYFDHRNAMLTITRAIALELNVERYALFTLRHRTTLDHTNVRPVLRLLNRPTRILVRTGIIRYNTAMRLWAEHL